jgi:hypothetical protein
MRESIVNVENSGNFVSKLTETEMKKLPEIDEQKLGANPYLNQLVIECTKRIDPEAFVADEDGTMLPASSVIEKTKPLKLYRPDGSKSAAMNLSAGALRMFVYIQYTLKYGLDYIMVTPEQYTKIATRNVYKKAIDELHRYGYIQPSVQRYVFWINPSLMFAGNRIRKWPNKVVVKNTWSPDKKTEQEEFENDQK